MKSGSGKNKGSTFELVLCKQFSLWLSNGEKKDLFCRNVGSGGTYTTTFQRHGKGQGHPGDLMASAPIAHEFLEDFLVEAKFWAELQLESALWGKGTLVQILKKTQQQAAKAKRHMMLVTKQNFRPTLLFVPSAIGNILIADLPAMMYHRLWKDSVLVCLMDDALRANPATFMAAAKLVPKAKAVQLRKQST